MSGAAETHGRDGYRLALAVIVAGLVVDRAWRPVLDWLPPSAPWLVWPFVVGIWLIVVGTVLGATSHD